MKIIVGLFSILLSAAMTREYNYPQPQTPFYTGVQAAAGHAHNHHVTHGGGNPQTFLVHTLSGNRQAYELQLSRAQQVFVGHVGAVPQRYQQHTALQQQQQQHQQQQQQQQQHSINRNPLLPAGQIVQTVSISKTSKGHGQATGYAPAQAQVAYNQPRVTQAQQPITYGPPGSSPAQPQQLPISYGPPASPPPAPAQLVNNYGPPQAQFQNYSPQGGFLAQAATPNTYDAQRTPQAPVSYSLPESQPTASQSPTSYGPPVTTSAAQQPSISYGAPLAAQQPTSYGPPVTTTAVQQPSISYGAPLAAQQPIISYGPPVSTTAAQQPSISYGSLLQTQQPISSYGPPAQALPLIANTSPEQTNTYDSAALSPYSSPTANNANQNFQQTRQPNPINPQPYHTVKLPNGERIQDGGHGAGGQQDDGGHTRTGDYHSQSEASQLDYYEYKQSQPGDTRDFQRTITTCDRNGQCQQVVLGPGQAAPSHQALLLEARAQTTPHHDRCKQFAAERAAHEAAYAGGSYQRGSAADAAAAAAAGTPVSTRGAERNAQGQLRPRDRRFYQYSETIIPKDPFN